MKQALSSNRQLLAWLVICAAFLLASTVLVGFALSAKLGEQQRTDRQICAAFNRFDAIITETLHRSAANLPKLAYFQAHPDELAAQQATIRDQIVQFRQRPCT